MFENSKCKFTIFLYNILISLEAQRDFWNEQKTYVQWKKHNVTRTSYSIN